MNDPRRYNPPNGYKKVKYMSIVLDQSSDETFKSTQYDVNIFTHRLTAVWQQ